MKLNWFDRNILRLTEADTQNFSDKYEQNYSKRLESWPHPDEVPHIPLHAFGMKAYFELREQKLRGEE